MLTSSIISSSTICGFSAVDSVSRQAGSASKTASESVCSVALGSSIASGLFFSLCIIIVSINPFLFNTIVKRVSLLSAYSGALGRVLPIAFANSVPWQMLEKKPDNRTITVVAFPIIDLNHSSRHLFIIVLPLLPSGSLDGAQRHPGSDG